LAAIEDRLRDTSQLTGAEVEALPMLIFPAQVRASTVWWCTRLKLQMGIALSFRCVLFGQWGSQAVVQTLLWPSNGANWTKSDWSSRCAVMQCFCRLQTRARQTSSHRSHYMLRAHVFSFDHVQKVGRPLRPWIDGDGEWQATEQLHRSGKPALAPMGNAFGMFE